MDSEKFLDLFQVVKAAAIALAVALVASLVFAGVLFTSSVSDKAIVPVNFSIKAVAVFVGCLFSLRGERGWLRGGLTGLAFTFLSGSVFSLIGGGFEFSWLLIVEVLFGVFVGAVSGIFAVNIRGN